MLDALKRMTDNLRNTVREVTAASTNVATGSEEMGSTAEQFSEGTSEQAAAAQETTSSMEEMTSMLAGQDASASEENDGVSAATLVKDPETRVDGLASAGASGTRAAAEVAALADDLCASLQRRATVSG
jgi:methyl-accepting chemotaxis protein